MLSTADVDGGVVVGALTSPAGLGEVGAPPGRTPNSFASASLSNCHLLQSRRDQSGVQGPAVDHEPDTTDRHLARLDLTDALAAVVVPALTAPLRRAERLVEQSTSEDPGPGLRHA